MDLATRCHFKEDLKTYDLETKKLEGWEKKKPKQKLRLEAGTYYLSSPRGCRLEILVHARYRYTTPL
jgi:hypothetical protein